MLLAASLLLAASAMSPGAAEAQSIIMAGSYQNFDVLNNTGGTAYGFQTRESACVSTSVASLAKCHTEWIVTPSPSPERM
jgi:hypothetical protein